MPFPSGDIIKYVMGGAVGSDDWSVGIWQTVSGLSSNPTTTQMNADVLATLTSFNTGLWSAATAGQKTVNASGTLLSTGKSYLYRAGSLTRQGTASITAVAGTSATILPFFTAMCCSLLTDTAGRSGRGRIYLPLTAGALLASTGQMNIGSLTSYATNVAAWLTGLNVTNTNFPGTPTMQCVVFSKTLGQTFPITTVRIDSIPDTQHGRTRKDIATSVGTHSV
jgi:hypothetical protein